MVLFRQRRAFACVFGLVIAAAILYLFAGARYRADMKILVRPGRADAPVSAQENAPIDLTRLEISEEELNSEVELRHQSTSSPPTRRVCHPRSRLRWRLHRCKFHLKRK